MRAAHLIVLAAACICILGCQSERDQAYAEIEAILANYELHLIEGHTHDFPYREQCLAKLAGRKDVRRMAEIGFNAGHSTVTLLAGNPGKTLTSLDLCTNVYYGETSSLLLEKYEGRLEIICGDSTETLPALIAERAPEYDFIHIDGGHGGDVPYQDLVNSLRLSHQDTLILVDDCNEVQKAEKEGWTGPDVNRAWAFATEHGLIEPVLVESCNVGNCLGKPGPRSREDAPEYEMPGEESEEPDPESEEPAADDEEPGGE